MLSPEHSHLESSGVRAGTERLGLEGRAGRRKGLAQTLDMGDVLHRAGLYLRARGAGAIREDSAEETRVCRKARMDFCYSSYLCLWPVQAARG